MWTHLTPSPLFCFSCPKSQTPNIIAKVYQGCLYLHDHGVLIVHGADYDPNSVSDAVQVRHDWQPGMELRWCVANQPQIESTRTVEHVLISQKSKRRKIFSSHLTWAWYKITRLFWFNFSEKPPRDVNSERYDNDSETYLITLQSSDQAGQSFCMFEIYRAKQKEYNLQVLSGTVSSCCPRNGVNLPYSAHTVSNWRK